MAGQVAIACVLLVGAALLTRSLVSLIRADRGYDPVNVLTARFRCPQATRPSVAASSSTLVERLRAVPGVTHAAYSTGAAVRVQLAAFIAFKMRSPRNPDIELDVQATLRVVSPDYFPAMRLRLIAGRVLSETDTARPPPAIVVNRTFAHQYLGDHPVGFRIPHPQGRPSREDCSLHRRSRRLERGRRRRRHAAGQRGRASSSRKCSRRSRSFCLGWQLRSDSDRQDNRRSARIRLHVARPGARAGAALALDSVMTLEDRVMTSLAKPRLYAVVLAWFGGFALLIAGVGLFGVLSSSVAQRTREIGLRSALGARAGHRDARAASGALDCWRRRGHRIGGGAVRRPAVVEVSVWHQPARRVDVCRGTNRHRGFAVVACLLPARRAAKVDPLTALRT